MPLLHSELYRYREQRISKWRFYNSTCNMIKLDRIPEIAKEIKTIAADEGLELVDLYMRTQGHRELFGPNGLHPNAAGARVIAEEVYSVLRLNKRGPEEDEQ